MANWLSGFVRQSWLVLLLAGVLGASLAAVDRSLQPRIQANAQQRLEHAILDVVPDGAVSAPVQLQGRTLYRVTDESGETVGWAVPAETMGFQDKIQLLVGLSANGAEITGVQVIKSLETPGLGDKIKTPEFRGQFAGKKTSATLEVVKGGQRSPNSIDAITGATISSRAVTRAVNEALSWAVPAVRQSSAR